MTRIRGSGKSRRLVDPAGAATPGDSASIGESDQAIMATSRATTPLRGLTADGAKPVRDRRACSVPRRKCGRRGERPFERIW